MGAWVLCEDCGQVRVRFAAGLVLVPVVRCHACLALVPPAQLRREAREAAKAEAQAEDDAYWYAWRKDD